MTKDTAVMILDTPYGSYRVEVPYGEATEFWHLLENVFVPIARAAGFHEDTIKECIPDVGAMT